jgi:hypothetical protein
MGRTCSTHGTGEERKVVHKVFGRKTRMRETTGIPRRSWGINKQMDLKNVEVGVECIHMAQDRSQCRAVVNTVMKLLVP